MLTFCERSCFASSGVHTATPGRAAASEAPKPRKSPAKKPLVNSAPQLLSFSVTVARLGGDLSDMEITKLEKFLSSCHKYGMGIERGETLYNLHAQCVVEVVTSSTRKFAADLKRALGWNALGPNDALKGQTHVKVTILKQVGLHTFHGLLGYISKDEGKGDWFRFKSKGVTAEDVAKGKERFAQYGAVNKNVVVLTPFTVMGRAQHWHDTKSGGCIADGTTFIEYVTTMLESGKFVLGSEFASHKNGLDPVRSEAVWKTLTQRDEICPNLVSQAMFGKPYLHKTRYFDSCAAPVSQAPHTTNQGPSQGHVPADTVLPEFIPVSHGPDLSRQIGRQAELRTQALAQAAALRAGHAGPGYDDLAVTHPSVSLYDALEGSAPDVQNACLCTRLHMDPLQNSSA